MEHVRIERETPVRLTELLERAADAGIFLSYKQGKLHFKSVGVFPEALKSEIVANKEALTRFLRQRQLDDENIQSHHAPTSKTASQPAVLSFAQQRLWFIDQLGGSSVQYNMPGAMRIQGRFDEDIAEQALVRIIERHEPLRTVFLNGEDGPLQRVRASFEFHLTRIDLSGLASDAQEHAVSEAQNSDAVKPFDLSSNLMLRASFLRLSEEEGVLLFNMHHIASDGWSIGILVKEFGQLYEAFSQSKPDPLPALAIQYIDYAQWQKGWLEGEVPEVQLSYWERQLENLPQVHGVPLDRPRPVVQTFNGAIHRFEVERATLEGLKQVAVKGQATLFMVLHGVFALLLSRHANSNDIVIGTPVANRPQKELEPLVGFFVNTLVLRTDCSGGRSFWDYLAYIKSLNLDAQANQDVPFELLVERLRPHRSTSHEALFQIMFSMNTNETIEVDLPGLKLTPLSSDRVAEKFDITLDAMEQADGLKLSFAYNCDLFNGSTMARMGEHFKTLLCGVVTNPDEKIEDLPLLTKAERHHLLYELNETAVDYPRDLCVHELFEAQVERSPEAVAVVFEEQRLSYGELNQRANQLAHYLRELGVGADTQVGLCMERSLEMVVGILGILKAGGAYVPLDPDYPQERLAYMIEDSAPAVVLTQAALQERLPVVNVPVLFLRLDADKEVLDNSPSTNPGRNEVGLTADNLAYIIYTSGSTGRPKGVMIAHRGIVNRLEWMQEAYGLEREDVVLQKTPYSFDVSVWEFFWPLQEGARLVVARPGGHQDPVYLGEVIEREQVTTLHFVPSMLRVFLEEERAVSRCGSLKRVMASGEALEGELVKSFHERLGGVELHNLYGPTEASVDVTAWACEGEREVVPIGRAIANMRTYVLDGGWNPVPVGVAGELCLGGVGLARGYVSQPGLTAERFVPDEWSGEAGGRLYRTGDRARYGEDGTLEYLGRLDAQVKIRGFRIELGEIEGVLVGHPGVRQAAVLAREDVPGQKRLVAYVTMDAEAKGSMGEETLITALRTGLQAQLPGYMVPAAFVLLDELPLTPNGKVDRKALPVPDDTSLIGKYVAPATPTEIELAEIWAEVLKRDPNTISATANFFELGGHSLAAMRMMTRVLSRFGADVPLREIFVAPTLAGFAQCIARACKSVIPKIASTDRDVPLPVSFAQQRLWIIDQIDGDSSQYNLSVALRLTGSLNRVALQRALDTLVERHEVLRTTFAAAEGSPMQVIHAAGAVKIVLMDLSTLSPLEQHAQVTHLAQAEVSKPFDLGHDLMLRVTLIMLSEEEHVVLFTQHHIASDGWSVGTLVREFSTLYRAYSQEQKNPLPALPIQYADYAQWQREWLQGEVLEQQLGYWRAQLGGAPLVHALPLDKARPVKQGFAGATYWHRLDEGLTTALKILCQRENITLFMLLQTVFALLVSRYSNELDVVIGTPVAGRLHQEVELLIGFFVNNLALHSHFDSNTSFRAVLAQQKQTILGAYAHQHVPFEMLVEYLNPERSLSHDPIFQIVFSLDNNDNEVLSLPDLTVAPVIHERVLAKVDLEVVAVERDQRLSIGWTYRTDLFTASSISDLAVSYERLLRGIVAEPGRGIFDYAILDAEQEESLLAKGRGNDRQYPRDLCVHEQFEAQVERSPEAVAVVFEEQRLSYGELNKKAERLARYLVEAGVEVESRVGIYLRRSMEMMIGVLGVMKAGGTYVPLELGLPKERVEYMIKDAGVEWVLVESSLMGSLPLGGVDVVVMDGAGTEAGWMEAVGEEGLLEEVKARPTAEHLAYIIYTSGSTGRPKGVMVPHRGLSNYVGHAVATYLGEEIEGSVVSSPLSFDATLTTLLPPLLVGRAVELLAEDESTLSRLAERLFEGEAGWLFKITPAHLEGLEYVERPRAVGVAPHRIVVGGEQLGAQTLRKWKGELLPRARFVNEYGPTEAVVGCSVWTLSDESGLEELEGMVAAPIGRPIGNTQLYVLGEGQQLQPGGSVGELYIGGEGLARGYLNQEELTRERFIANPFSEEEGSRLYKTGDLVRWLASGELMFVGRRDDQVKLRGFRIELGEIETALLEQGGVEQAVVVAREDVPGQKRLVAYVTMDAEAKGSMGEETLITALRTGLQAQLPGYMVPAAFVLLDELPLTPNGKVDRKALPVPEGEDGQAAVYVGARNAVEQALCEVWQEVLKRERIGVQDNFFSLGGDSILSIRVVSMLKSRGIVLEIKDIFQYQTIEQLAAQAVQRSSEVQASRLEVYALLTEEERKGLGDGYEDAYPMSALQAGMVFHTQLEQFSGIYHDIMAEHVKCPWDRGCFEQALAACIQEHPVLRTGFRLSGGRPLQHVHTDIELPLAVEDLRGQTVEEQDRYLAQWTEERKRHVFDWERGPLFHIHIFRRTDESFEFVLSFHHGVLDGWSRAALTTTLYNRYERLLRGEGLEPVRVDWTYREFIAQEQQVVGNPAAKAYFAAMLEDAPTEQLPRLKSARPGRSQGRLEVEDFGALSDRVIKLAKELGVPVQSVLLAAHFKVLSTVSGQKRAVSCVTHNGRPETAGAERSLGLFLNSLPISVEVAPGSWRELIERVAQAGTASMEYRGYPLSKIQADLGWTFSEILFNYTHFHVYNDLIRNAERSLELLGSSGFEETNFDLEVHVSRDVDDDTMSLALVYNAQIWDEEFMARLGQYYAKAFERMLEGLDEPHHRHSLLSAEEVQQLLATWNATQVDFPRDLCLHEGFELQARQRPETVALVSEGQTITYGELDGRANRLARVLRAHGVKLEDRVGVCLERSPEMVVSLLGVLKAGGAYVPLEPEYPEERLAMMVADGGVKVAITMRGQAGRLPETMRALVLDEMEEELKGQSGEGIASGTGLDNLAYIIYTSGSTGRPKGVMIAHRGIVNRLEWMQEAYGLEREDVVLQKTPYSFDVSVWEFFWPLQEGARLVVARPGGHQDPVYLGEVIEREQVTTLHFVPSMLRVFLEEERAVSRCGSLKRVMASGEALEGELVKSFHERLGGVELHNLYGPTEASVDVTAWACEGEREVVPIGRAIANMRTYVLDGGWNPVPVGVAGELCLGGVGLARGYVSQPGLTAERFVPDEWSGEAGGRLYRTGDRARYGEDGTLEYLGRLDAQVKIRGFRIELGEIEGVLVGHPGVRQAAVLAQREVGGGGRLIAYVSLSGEAADRAGVVEELRGYLGKKLPAYMVPQHFLVLEQFPTTSSGKLNRRALPAPDASRPVLSRAYVAPSTEQERVLAEIWVRLLGVEKVGVTDNFFELGGHSLLATRVISEVNSRFGVELFLRVLFESPTIEGVNKEIERLRASNALAQEQPIRRLARQAVKVERGRA